MSISIALPETVSTSLQILRASWEITRRSEEVPQLEERIARVVEVFSRSGASWTLVGAHAVGTLTQPRATVDFDFVIDESKLRLVLTNLDAEFGELEAIDLGPALKLRALDVDLIRSTTHPLFLEALTRVRTIGEWRLPVPEVLIVLKFLACVSPWRERTKRMYDAADMRALVLCVGMDALDGELMTRLSATVYPGAETEFMALLERIKRGEPLTI